ncbi:MAG: hypothetical protein ACI964_002095 [Spirosomataceae bacterium]|jgi:hypothetical protein
MYERNNTLFDRTITNTPNYKHELYLIKIKSYE